MSYQALLFCPDEKTARTVTQVLSELEFSVEPCAEPFAAVKKLMGQHFDAVVVDCDNEQNATLLFKSARNSTSNQAALAVAVVEGQAGVAKAFRIGANLVLTKPINVEQAKGTLRVARGLLRKGEAGKPAAAPPAAKTQPAATPVATQPATPAQRAAAPAPKPAAAGTLPPTPKPAAPRPQPQPTSTFGEAPALAPAVERRKVASTIPSNAKLPPAIPPVSAPAAPTPAPSRPVAKSAPKPAATTLPSASAPKPAATASSSVMVGSAASAPAPARAPQPVPVEEPSISSGLEGVAESAPLTTEPSPAASAPAPSFTFGGANAPEESSSGSKKKLFALVALVLVGALAYIGWSTFGRHSDSPAAQPGMKLTAPPISMPAPAPSKPAAAQPASDSATPTSPAASTTQTDTDDTAPAPTEDTPPAPVSTKSAPLEKKSAPASKANTIASQPADGPAPLVVKGGAAPAVKSPAPVPDATAPSMVGMANPSGAEMPNLGSAASATPVLQRLNVSQGVSRGLLIRKIDPVYPPSAINMKVEGPVELSATISTSGDITGIKVLSGNKQLTQAAIDAVKRWKYKPYLLNGEPVEIQTQVTIIFKLPQQ